MTKRALLALVAAAAFAVAILGPGSASPVLADNGPHVATGSDATPDKCAGCHRIHTGQNEYLHKEGGTIADFCYSCHGNGGPGSDLAVQEGKYYGYGATLGPPYGSKTAYAALRGGGFETALIDTDDPTPDSIGSLTTAEPVTSWHTIDGTAGTLWGNGPLGTPGAGPSYTLDCASCHDPHGNGQYRILRPIPAGSGATAVSVTDQPTPKNYRASNQLYMGGDVSLVQMSSWCATCHTRYRATSAAATGDPIYKYRHRSDGTSNRACITCHASHGTNALMTGSYSSTVEWPAGGTGATDTNNSRLLKMNNRGICLKCHLDY